MFDSGFALDASVGITELRNDAWLGRLERFGHLRLERRGEVLGVVLSPQEWRTLIEHLERSAQLLEEAESTLCARIVDTREDAQPMRGEQLRASLEERLSDLLHS